MAELPLEARGRRPAFFDPPALDKMVTMLVELMSEHWVARERQYALERVLEERGVIEPGAVDAYEWSEAEEARLAERRQRFIADVFRTLESARTSPE